MVLSRSTPEILARDVTPESLYLRRREFILGSSSTALMLATGTVALSGCEPGDAGAGRTPARPTRSLTALQGPPALSTDEPQTSYEDATRYNNFYEFGTGKEDPAANAGSLRTEPWPVSVEGAVAKPGVVPLEELLAPHSLEERIYRLRCVEAWSMVIPWVGIPLGAVLARFEPTSKARYVAFETLHDPDRKSVV